MKIQSERVALASDGDQGKLSSAIYNPVNSFAAVRALITFEGTGASGTFRTDGGAPSATEGHTVAEGDIVELDNAEEIAGFRFRQSGTIALSVYVSYTFEEEK